MTQGQHRSSIVVAFLLGLSAGAVGWAIASSHVAPLESPDLSVDSSADNEADKALARLDRVARSRERSTNAVVSERDALASGNRFGSSAPEHVEGAPRESRDPDPFGLRDEFEEANLKHEYRAMFGMQPVRPSSLTSRELDLALEQNPDISVPSASLREISFDPLSSRDLPPRLLLRPNLRVACTWVDGDWVAFPGFAVGAQTGSGGFDPTYHTDDFVAAVAYHLKRQLPVGPESKFRFRGPEEHVVLTAADTHAIERIVQRSVRRREELRRKFWSRLRELQESERLTFIRSEDLAAVLVDGHVRVLRKFEVPALDEIHEAGDRDRVRLQAELLSVLR